MRDASVAKARLVVVDGVVRCGEPGRGKGKLCATPVLENGQVVHHRAGRNWHSFNLPELVRAAVDSGQISLEDLLCEYYALEGCQQTGLNLEVYRQIEGLIVIGPEEWEQAMRGPNGENPLGLSENWCPRSPLPPTWTSENLNRLAELCHTPKWNCTPVLQLELHEVAGQPITLKQMYEWWGVAHDSLGPGTLHNVDWSNWPITEGHNFASEPANEETRWVLRYMDFPAYTTMLPWERQQQETKKNGLAISNVASDVLTMSLCAILGRKFRTQTWARTSTPFKGRPLEVGWVGGDGVSVSQFYSPENAHENIGAAAEVVSRSLLLLSNRQASGQFPVTFLGVINNAWWASP